MRLKPSYCYQRCKAPEQGARLQHNNRYFCSQGINIGKARSEYE